MRAFHIPFDYLANVPKAGKGHFTADLELRVRNAAGDFVPLHYVRFDTGAGFTTIPLSWARKLDIPFSEAPDCRIPLTGSTGSGHAFLNEITFMYPDLPELAFTTDCLINPMAPRPMLALGDVIRNFHLATAPKVRARPYGSFVLRIRPDHLGQRMTR